MNCTYLERLARTAQKSIPIVSGRRKQFKISSIKFGISFFPSLTVIVKLKGVGLPARLYWLRIYLR